MKRILVTGGAGYIASNLIKELIKDNEVSSIISIDNYFSGSKDNHVNSEKIKYIEGNTWEIESLLPKNDFDIIYHFGEYSRIVHSFDDIDFVIKSLVHGTLAVLQFTLQNNSKFIYSASSSKFGNNGEDENLSPYAFFKSKNVELIKNYHSWFNLDFEICYFFNVYGRNHIKKGKYATVIAIFEEQFKQGLPISVVKPGTQSRDFTHIDDVCNGILLASNANRNDEYFLRYGKNYKLIDVAKSFSDNIIYIPERGGERFTSEYFKTDTEKVLQWSPKIELFEYIKEFKLKLK
jgi:UDP-glucose 4-epimerase